MFRLPVLGSKGRDIQGLLENSVKLLGRDKDIFFPAVYTTIFKSIYSAFFFYSIYCFGISKNYKYGILTILSLILLRPIMSLISMRYKAITSYMVSEILQGIDTNMSSARRGISGKGGVLLMYSFVDFLLSYATTGSDKKKSGFASVVLSIVLAAFKEVWDLVKNFSLPAIVIDNCRLKEVPSRLSLIKKNVPAALVGILGIDVVGSIFSSIVAVIFLPAIIIGGMIGYLGADFFPKEWIFSQALNGQEPIIINLLPIFITFFISTVISAFTSSMAEIVKTSYFTTFYLSLSHPNIISEDLRKNVTRYLDFNGRLGGYKLFKKSESSSQAEAYELDVETGHDIKILKKIAKTFKLNLERGAKELQIRKALKGKSYPDDLVESGYQLYKKSA